MNKIFLYAHGGSGNHGCEAIVRSTIDIFNLEKSECVLVSSNPDEDREYGLNQLCSIIPDVNKWSKTSFSFFKAYLQLKIKRNFEPMDMIPYQATVNSSTNNDIALSIGGDNYCYADVNKYTMLHNMYIRRGVKTILWGCSVEPELLQNKKIAEDISKYDLITARETISYEALKNVNSNTFLVPDTAFYLETIHLNLPAGFTEKNYVGINVSPMVIDREYSKGIVEENYIRLIDYILKSTDLKVLLIPHVVWKDGDDRIPLRKLEEKYANTGRVALVEDCDCRELKGYIARSRFFIGARTHATIAAYSSCVPTLVVGYSVKARGIARDLFGTEEGYVIPVQQMKKRDDLLEAFKFIEKNEAVIITRLENKIPQYTKADRFSRVLEILKEWKYQS